MWYIGTIEDYSTFLKEGNSTIYNDKDEPNEHYAKNNASDT